MSVINHISSRGAHSLLTRFKISYKPRCKPVSSREYCERRCVPVNNAYRHIHRWCLRIIRRRHNTLQHGGKGIPVDAFAIGRSHNKALKEKSANKFASYRMRCENRCLHGVTLYNVVWRKWRVYWLGGEPRNWIARKSVLRLNSAERKKKQEDTMSIVSSRLASCLSSFIFIIIIIIIFF